MLKYERPQSSVSNLAPISTFLIVLSLIQLLHLLLRLPTLMDENYPYFEHVAPYTCLSQYASMPFLRITLASRTHEPVS